MNARSPTEVYLCVNKPGIGAYTASNFQRGLIKFTDLAVNTDIEWFIKNPDSEYSQFKITAVTPHETDIN